MVRNAGHWRQNARRLKRETYALYFAVRDPRVRGTSTSCDCPAWRHGGSGDDPAHVLDECRQRASRLEGTPRNWIAAAIIVAVWIALAVAAVYWLVGWLARSA